MPCPTKYSTAVRYVDHHCLAFRIVEGDDADGIIDQKHCGNCSLSLVTFEETTLCGTHPHSA